MFGWRRRNEGFQWNEYVRTTILVRRAQRQKRVEDVRVAAVERVKDVRDKGVDVARKQVEAVGAKGRAGAEQFKQTLADAAIALGRAMADTAMQAWTGLKALLRSLPRPDPEHTNKAKDVLSVAAMYAGDMPRRWRKFKPYLLPAAGCGAGIFAFGTLLSPSNSLPTSHRTLPLETASVSSAGEADDTISGYASAVTGDMLRLNRRLVRLAGIDAPVKGQSCAKPNGRRFDCASAAESALSRLLRRQRVSCELNGERRRFEAVIGNCRVGDIDLARELVRAGHVFANNEGGSPYAREEELARTEKAGIWQSDVDRPDVWRTKLWDEAKRSAPEGCPIKGVVKGGGRFYAMPWSNGYETRRVREIKGERWFCSEDEALAAGFKLAEGF